MKKFLLAAAIFASHIGMAYAQDAVQVWGNSCANGDQVEPADIVLMNFVGDYSKGPADWENFEFWGDEWSCGVTSVEFVSDNQYLFAYSCKINDSDVANGTGIFEHYKNMSRIRVSTSINNDWIELKKCK